MLQNLMLYKALCSQQCWVLPSISFSTSHSSSDHLLRLFPFVPWANQSQRYSVAGEISSATSVSGWVAVQLTSWVQEDSLLCRSVGTYMFGTHWWCLLWVWQSTPHLRKAKQSKPYEYLYKRSEPKTGVAFSTNDIFWFRINIYF